MSRKNWVNGEMQIRQLMLSELLELQIFSDNSSAEIFVNNGAVVFSMRYFTSNKNLEMEYAGLENGENLQYFTL